MTVTTSKPSSSTAPTEPEEWRAALASLPSLEQTGGKIPAFFFAHGHPGLAVPKDKTWAFRLPLGEIYGAEGKLAQFLKDFGQELVEKYKPKGIVVFSAHWETKTPLVSDWGDQNPLLYDYYGFDHFFYSLRFPTRGSRELSQRTVDVMKENGLKARLSPITEARGEDGRPSLPFGHVANGLDHGVFLPFRHMFGEDGQLLEQNDIPVVEASIDTGLNPENEWALGRAVRKLREEGILVLAGGLTIHTFRDPTSWQEKTASPVYHSWHKSILSAINDNPDPISRKDALLALTKHAGFRSAQPREDHFVPLYVAAGAGESDGDGRTEGAKLLAGFYGAETIAFGV